MILDATAGRRGIWFDKKDDETIFLDIRKSVKPNVVGDAKALPFKDNIFQMVVFDPPHVSLGPQSIMAKRYGRFNMREIRDLVRKGTLEFHRVLKDGGLLLFKWNTHDMGLEKVLSFLTNAFKPLFGQKVAYRTKHSSKTYWVCLRRKEVSKTLPSFF